MAVAAAESSVVHFAVYFAVQNAESTSQAYHQSCHQSALLHHCTCPLTTQQTLQAHRIASALGVYFTSLLYQYCSGSMLQINQPEPTGEIASLL